MIGEGAVDVVGGVVAGCGQRTRRGQVGIVLQQAAIGLAGLVDLDGVGRAGVGKAVHAFPTAVEVVEAVVFLVDDDEVFDFRQLRRCVGGHGASPGRGQNQTGGKGRSGGD